MYAFFIIFTLVVFPAEAKTIRVGWQIFFNYQNIDDENNHFDYNYEYLQKIAQYTGWDYEYVPGSLSELIEKVKTGEVDLLDGVVYTQERDQILNYCTNVSMT